ncbi:MAG: hypothetical protein LQ340_007417, partial [Diploschistes diacapsis]
YKLPASSSKFQSTPLQSLYGSDRKLTFLKAIFDPNTSLTLWESGAIILYLIERYNPERALTYDTLNEKHLLNQWLFFQCSGQGPYFGQSGWFSNYHPEKIQSAIDRYSTELKRILSVLEGHLSGAAPVADNAPPGAREWLVGNKITFADIAFVPWNVLAGSALPTGPDIDPLKEFPHVHAWHQRLVSRPSFKKLWEMRNRYMEEQQLTWLGLQEGKTIQEVMEQVAKEKAEKGT